MLPLLLPYKSLAASLPEYVSTHSHQTDYLVPLRTWHFSHQAHDLQDQNLPDAPTEKPASSLGKNNLWAKHIVLFLALLSPQDPLSAWCVFNTTLSIDNLRVHFPAITVFWHKTQDLQRPRPMDLQEKEIMLPMVENSWKQTSSSPQKPFSAWCIFSSTPSHRWCLYVHIPGIQWSFLSAHKSHCVDQPGSLPWSEPVVSPFYIWLSGSLPKQPMQLYRWQQDFPPFLGHNALLCVPSPADAGITRSHTKCGRPCGHISQLSVGHCGRVRDNKKKPHQVWTPLRAHLAAICGILCWLRNAKKNTKEPKNAQLYQHLRLLKSEQNEFWGQNTQPRKKHGQKMIHPANAQL